jgi:hypothetical protein
LSSEGSLGRGQEIGKIVRIWPREIIDLLLVGFYHKGFPGKISCDLCVIVSILKYCFSLMFLFPNNWYHSKVGKDSTLIFEENHVWA